MYLTSRKGITDYSEHKCEVIVNTTFNVEGKFIGSRGLSGFICQRTGSGKSQIQKEIKECISKVKSKNLYITWAKFPNSTDLLLLKNIEKSK